MVDNIRIEFKRDYAETVNTLMECFFVLSADDAAKLESLPANKLVFKVAVASRAPDSNDIRRSNRNVLYIFLTRFIEF